MRSERRFSFAARAAWGTLVVLGVLALGALWRVDRTRVWESPRWDAGLIILSAAGAEAHDAPVGSGEAAFEGAGPPAATETWAVAINPRCERCRASLARGLALRQAARAPVRLAALVVDTRLRPTPATVAALAADETRWDSTGAWRHRWGHRVYGELLCFDKAGAFIRTLAPLSDSLAARRALRFASSLARGGGS